MGTLRLLGTTVGLLLIAGFLGCGQENVAIEKPTDDRADAVGRLCRDAGEPDDCDICAVRDWYGDGECDDFCATPDPDCGPVEPQCSWENPSPLGDTSDDLAAHMTGSVTYTIDDIDDLTVIESRQLYAAEQHLGCLQGNEDLDAAFECSDDRDFTRYDLTIDGADYHWIHHYAGDTEVGVVFRANTVEIVAEISDGDIMDCGLYEAPVTNGEVECDWGTDTGLGESSETLESNTVASRWVTIEDIDNLSELEAQQIFAAALHLELLTGDEDFDIVFDVADSGEFNLAEVVIDATSYDWVKFYAGDTEVGVVFADGTLDIVGEVGDGDILGCVPAE